ncbi:serine phosphatase [Candidatus Koribacter versatilis Ellin345]|uniref:Serine phosphatase n=1 Tax=Koribacter versatilis (strain Ellin345) TaxID=204669 RepID=Q1IIM2_KORVE|nr:PP2C family protein-serine/threonine phosphatase [Candidatus Koribacter versatilis]ABF43278.1 serine phosphatase [Candidatus Koribacter versatilis Ellin345]
MFSLFRHETHQYRKPQPANMPDHPQIHFFALYRGARTGGDFYDFAAVNGRILMFFCDISGNRDEALHIAASVQETFQKNAAELFSGSDINESDRLSDLMLSLNRSIIDVAGGPRYTPAFLACMEPGSGMLTYINAGHLPALVRDSDGITTLDASGLPLGLFTHSTHDAQICVALPGSSLLLVSRGLVETKRHHEEFGIDRVKNSMLEARFVDARELCAAMHAAAQEFLDNKQPDNDLTTLAMVRPQAAAQTTV